MSDTQSATIAVVCFVRPWELYYRNDLAAFPLAVAQRLVRLGIAVWQQQRA